MLLGILDNSVYTGDHTNLLYIYIYVIAAGILDPFSSLLIDYPVNCSPVYRVFFITYQLHFLSYYQ